MLQLLQSSPQRFVSEAVVSAITAIASHAEGLFEKYYSTITPWLKTVITAAAVPKADRLLRAKALECLSRVALAVGKQRFAADAPEVLEAMKRMQTGPLEADDPLGAYLLRSWGRMAECLGPDMGDYYQAVMPPLIAQVWGGPTPLCPRHVRPVPAPTPAQSRPVIVLRGLSGRARNIGPRNHFFGSKSKISNFFVSWSTNQWDKAVVNGFFTPGLCGGTVLAGRWSTFSGRGGQSRGYCVCF